MAMTKLMSSIQTTLVPVQDCIILKLGTLRKTFLLKPHEFKSGARGYLCASQYKTADGKLYRVNAQLKEFDAKTYYYWRRAHEQ